MVVLKIENEKNKKTRKVWFSCDECGKKYCKSGSNTFYRLKKLKHHFCSRICSNKSFANGKLKKEANKTRLERYGDESFVKTKEFRIKSDKTCIEKYGFACVFLNPEMKKRVKETNQRKFGRDTFTGSEQHKNSIDFHEVYRKGVITMLENGTYKKSKPEDRMFDILTNFFKNSNIERQFLQRLSEETKRRSIVDFLIILPNGVKFFLELDGKYWHGVGRNIEDVKKSNGVRDKSIHTRMLNDIYFNNFCIENKLLLVRIIDTEIKNKTDEQVIDIVLDRLEKQKQLIKEK